MLLHPPYTLWHLSYVAIGAWSRRRRRRTVGGHVGRVRAGRRSFGPRPRRTARPPAPHRHPQRVLVGRRQSAWPVRRHRDRRYRRVGAGLAVFIVAGVVLTVGYNLELLGGRLHNDVVFAAAWGAFPLSPPTTPRPAPLAPRRGRGRCSTRCRGTTTSQHTSPHASPKGGVSRWDGHAERRQPTADRRALAAHTAGAGAPRPWRGAWWLWRWRWCCLALDRTHGGRRRPAANASSCGPAGASTASGMTVGVGNPDRPQTSSSMSA